MIVSSTRESVFLPALTGAFDKDETDFPWNERTTSIHTSRGMENYVFRDLKNNAQHTQIQINGMIYHIATLPPLLTHLGKVMETLVDVDLQYIYIQGRKHLQFRGWRTATDKEKRGLKMPCHKDLNSEITSPYASDPGKQFDKWHTSEFWTKFQRVNDDHQVEVIRTPRNRAIIQTQERMILGEVCLAGKLVDVFPQLIALHLELKDVQFDFEEYEENDETHLKCTYKGWVEDITPPSSRKTQKKFTQFESVNSRITF